MCLPPPQCPPRRRSTNEDLFCRKMDTRAPLLGLPDDLLSGALSRFCSAIALVRLAATCARLRELCKQAAEVLLEEVGAAATTVAARVAGASTLRNLALLCGRAPLITERFYEYVQKRLDGATELLGFVMGFVRRMSPSIGLRCSFSSSHSETWMWVVGQTRGISKIHAGTNDRG